MKAYTLKSVLVVWALCVSNGFWLNGTPLQQIHKFPRLYNIGNLRRFGREIRRN